MSLIQRGQSGADSQVMGPTRPNPCNSGVDISNSISQLSITITRRQFPSRQTLQSQPFPIQFLRGREEKDKAKNNYLFYHMKKGIYLLLYIPLHLHLCLHR